MSISPLTVIAPQARHERSLPPLHARRSTGSDDGLRLVDDSAFRAFVDENYHRFAEYVARSLSGTHAGAGEDALQEGLIKIWTEWDQWPADDDDRLRFAHRALRLAALEAVRRRIGRDGSPRAGEIVVDFADVQGTARPSRAAEHLARDLGRAIATQSMVKDQLAYLERASLVAAIATLTDLEQRVLFMTAQGDDCKQIARDLGVGHQQAREALMRARRLCRMLIEHADGQKVSEKEAKQLWQYRDGQLSGKRARELKRHVEHCTACQRLLGLENAIGTNGALVILPIPVVLLATGKAIGGASTSSAAPLAGTSSAATGTGVGVPVGGTLLTPSTPAAWTGSVLAPLAAKGGLALAGLAVAGSFGGVWKLAHDRLAQQPAAAIAAKVGTPPLDGPDRHDAALATPAAPAAPRHRRKPARRTSRVPAHQPSPTSEQTRPAAARATRTRPTTERSANSAEFQPGWVTSATDSPVATAAGHGGELGDLGS